MRNARCEIVARHPLSRFRALTEILSLAESREIIEENFQDLVDNLYKHDYDGQPDEAQEWHDFDPDC